MIHKLERAERIQELNPPETLKRIGLTPGNTFCDIGAGTGIFTFAAAALTENKVYAVEISPEMLELLQSRKSERKAENVILENDVKNVPDSSCDAALLCTVFHELEKPGEMLEEIRRILKPGGTLAIIEFWPKKTVQFGPPPERRWSPERLEEQLTAHRFRRTALFELGENLYTLTCQT